jgi:hypothetical protein
MNKINLSLTAVLLSVTLLAGCTGNNVKSQSRDNTRNNILTNDRGSYRPLDIATPRNVTNYTTTGTVQFNDVPSGEWFAGNIQWGSNLGIIDGYPDGSFQPNKSMTRAEVIKIIKSLADKGFLTVPSGGTTPTPSPTATPVASPTVTPTVTPTVSPTVSPTATP